MCKVGLLYRRLIHLTTVRIGIFYSIVRKVLHSLKNLVRKVNLMFKIDSPSKKTLPLLFMLVDLLILPAILLYFTGFLFTYYFLKHFGISTQVLDIPTYQHLVLSFTVLDEHKVFVIITLVLLVLLYFLIRLVGILGNIFLIIILVILFPLLANLSFKTAKDEADKVMDKKIGKRVIFTLKEPVKKQYPAGFINANKSGNLVLLLETKNQFYVFLQNIQNKTNSDIPTIPTVFNMPKEQVLLVEILLVER